MSHGLKLLGLVLLLVVSVLLSLAAGASWVPPGQVARVLVQAGEAQSAPDLLVSTRVSRTLMRIAVGASLAVAGALMQALTRNPLASPGLFGVNAGATFAIIIGTTVWGLTAQQHWLWCAFAGAALAGGLVWVIGHRGQGGLSPLRMVLAGAAMTAMFSAFSQALLVINQEGLDTVLFWLAGSLTERDLALAAPLLWTVLAGLLGAMALSAQVNVLNAGDAIAVGLGQRVGLIRLLMGVLVICLAGSAVALAGSIGFIGLLVPHMVRRSLSMDHRWLLPGCALAGGSLLLLADTVARVVILPQEVPVGVMTALVGAPFFIALARRGGRYEQA